MNISYPLRTFSAVICIGIVLLTAIPLFAAGTKKAVSHNSTEIIISAAASLTNAMQEAIAAYKKIAPNVIVTPTYGSSGSLQKQIEQGAPSDIFFSAAPAQMDALEKQGLLAAGTRRNMLENNIVLIVPKDSKKGISAFDDVKTSKIGQIALGEAASVPAGQYAEQVFAKINALDAARSKAVYAKDVRQVLTYVEQGEVDAGVVYATDAAVSSKVIVAASAPAGSHLPVIYPAAVLTTGLNPEAAKDFLAWLSSPDAGKIFAKYGFTLPRE